MPRPSLYFLVGYVSVPQTKEQAEASVNPPPGACNGLARSLSALIWGHGGCCHGNRWQSRWRVGQRQLMLFVVCFNVLCVLCCVCLHKYSIFFYFLANQLVNINRDKGQINKLCAAVNKKPPQNHPDIIRCLSMEWFIQVKHNLILMQEWHCGAIKIAQKWYSEKWDLARYST